MRMIVRTSVGLLVCVFLASAATAHAQAGATTFDHLKCYKIKDPLKVKHTVDLVPEQIQQFSIETGCQLKSPAKFFCIDVRKVNVQPTPGGPPIQGDKAQDYLCYKLKCPNIKKPLSVADQFGQRDILVIGPDHLCAPAVKGTPPFPTRTPTPTPPPPTPTPTQTPFPCDFDSNGICNGDCPPPFPAGSQCLFDPATGNCRCGQPTDPCSSTTGTCGGLCNDPADVCVQPPGAVCDCYRECGSTGIHQCGGYCPSGQICQVLPADGCGCLPPPQPDCANVGGPACDGTCPLIDEACVLGAAGHCFCQATPLPCGQLKGPPVCWGDCPVGQACVNNPATPPGCVCQ
jgi:hypothetical protein